jgi:hypothetical protein
MYKRWKTAKQEEKEAATIQEEANAPKKHSKKGWKTSRRHQQRWRQKQKEKEVTEVTALYFPPATDTYRTLLNVIQSVNVENLNTYGFMIDPSLPCWERLADTILHMKPRQFFSRLDQMAYHNLCSKTQLPLGA